MPTAETRSGTREKILSIARELFTAQGYAGTSIADIAHRLGTSKAALYYHFTSKAEIIEALLAGPITAYEELAAAAAAGRYDAAGLLGAVVDTTAGFYELANVIGSDPSVQSAQRDRILDRSRAINGVITAALAGKRPDVAARARAHAAYAAAKHGTLAAMAASDGRLTPAARTVLVSAALRALEA